MLRLIFNKANRCIVQKADSSCDIEFPKYIFAVNKLKGFDCILIYYYKWISLYGKTISEYNVKPGGWSKTPNFGVLSFGLHNV